MDTEEGGRVMAKKKEHEFTRMEKVGEDAYMYVCCRCRRKYVHKEGTEFSPRGPVCPGKPQGRAASNMRGREALKRTAQRMLGETGRDRKAKKRLRRQGVRVSGRVKVARGREE